jgi:outer membrane protein OmpA-like peptidoglycan-associated protein
MLCFLHGVGQQALTVHFETGRSALTAAAKARLDSLLTVLDKDIRSKKLELEGHCDAIGSTVYNQSLSERRVSAVREYLIKNGVNSNLVKLARGWGELKPVNGNESEDDRRANRRVEIRIEDPGAGSENVLGDRSLSEKLTDSAAIGKTVTLKHINFYGGMHRLLPESLPIVSELLDVMKSNPGLVIVVQGHICCQPHTEDGLDRETGKYNLSEKRAKVIHDYLLASGIDKARVSYKGFGHSRPIYPYPERDEEERKANRRVEILIVSQ